MSIVSTAPLATAAVRSTQTPADSQAQQAQAAFAQFRQAVQQGDIRAFMACFNPNGVEGALVTNAGLAAKALQEAKSCLQGTAAELGAHTTITMATHAGDRQLDSFSLMENGKPVGQFLCTFKNGQARVETFYHVNHIRTADIHVTGPVDSPKKALQQAHIDNYLSRYSNLAKKIASWDQQAAGYSHPADLCSSPNRIATTLQLGFVTRHKLVNTYILDGSSTDNAPSQGEVGVYMTLDPKTKTPLELRIADADAKKFSLEAKFDRAGHISQLDCRRTCPTGGEADLKYRTSADGSQDLTYDTFEVQLQQEHPAPDKT